MRFTIPAGTHGVTMPGQSKNESMHEREIVLGGGSIFRIDKVEQNVVDGKVRHVVHCTYLGFRDEDK